MTNPAADVLVVGAGPVGLTLASELARHGAAVRIIEKAATPSTYCRAIGVTPRTLEVMEDMGIARDLIDAGLWLTGGQMVVDGKLVHRMRSDFPDLDYGALGVPQYSTEAVLRKHLGAFGVAVERGAKLASLEQDGDGVHVGIETSQGIEKAHFRFVVGCDGAHSMVRQSLGISFEGDAFPMEFMLGDVHIGWSLPRGFGMRAMHLVENDAPDLFVAVPLPQRGRYRVSTIAPERLRAPRNSGTGVEHGIQVDRPGATLADLQEVADRLLPEPAVLSDMRWSSIFRISMRLAGTYRVGSALIAGDACHIHPPTGGQGMNTGIQDAYNLGWKLALVTKGLADVRLLDSYEAERRPVAAEVVARTTEQSINFGRDKTPPNRLQDTQVLVNYRGGPLAKGSPSELLEPGDRVPDVHGLRRDGIGFPFRLFDLLKGTRFVLIVRLVAPVEVARVEAFAASLDEEWPGLLRVVAIDGQDVTPDQPPGIEVVRDPDGTFAAAFGDGQRNAWVVRPDNYLGFASDAWSEAAILTYLRETIGLN